MGSENEYKIVVLGSGGVGKSALTIRLVTNSFLEEYDPTIEDSYRKECVVDDQPALLDILDTAGQEEFSSMQDQWMREGEAFVLVYSIVKSSTLDELEPIRNKLLRVRETEDPDGTLPVICLVGNKCDLEGDREVARETAEDLAKGWQCPLVEVSAKNKIRNEEPFFQCVRMLRDRENASQTKKRGKRKCTIL